MNAAPVPIGVLVGTWLPPSETFVYDQLTQARRTVGFVCARRRLPEVETRFPYDRVCTLDRPGELVFKWTRNAPRFTQYWRSAGVKLIHAHFGTNGAHALDIADRLDVPLVVSFHGHDVAGLERKNRFALRYFQYQMLEARLWQRASLLLCASADLAVRLVEEHGAPAERVVVHRLGVDLTRFAFEHRARSARTVLSVGRLVEKKGLEYGLAAFARALPAIAPARYRIVGDGPLRGELRRRARDLGIADAVDFIGALSHDAVRAEMRAADALLCPSVTARDGDLESGVLVIKEAAATGLVAIGSAHGGIGEIIDDEQTGFLAPERDVAALARRLVDTFTDPELRERLGRAASQKMAVEYDTRLQNAKLESLLLDCL